MRIFSLKIVLFVMMVACLGACVGQEAKIVDKQMRLKERTEGYIAVRGQGDLMAMQKYYRNPGMARIGNIVYRSSEIVALNVAEEGETAQSKLKNSIMVMGFTFDKAPQTLNWEWYENDWYLVVAAAPANPFGQSKNKNPKRQESSK